MASLFFFLRAQLYDSSLSLRFRLINLATPEFVEEWRKISAGCETCLDPDFALVLFRKFPDLGSKTLDEQDAARQEVQSLLKDISEWAPLTSDRVEIKNGQVQWSVSKRGSQNVKGGRAASETTLLQAAVQQNEWAQREVARNTLPAKTTSSSIHKMVGVSSANQFTAKDKGWKLGDSDTAYVVVEFFRDNDNL